MRSSTIKEEGKKNSHMLGKQMISPKNVIHYFCNYNLVIYALVFMMSKCCLMRKSLSTASHAFTTRAPVTHSLTWKVDVKVLAAIQPCVSYRSPVLKGFDRFMDLFIVNYSLERDVSLWNTLDYWFSKMRVSSLNKSPCMSALLKLIGHAFP